MLQFTVKKCSKKCSKMNILENNSLVVGITKTADCLEAFKKRNAPTKMITRGQIFQKAKVKKILSRGILTFFNLITMVHSLWLGNILHLNFFVENNPT